MRERYGQALRLASTLHLSRNEWLKIRQLGIGSSDAAAAIGLSPYKCALSLWLEKTGRKAPEDLSQKEPVLWGTILEPVLAGVYAQRTGQRVRRVNAVLQHAEHTFMLANLDREVIGLPEGPGVLEIKTASYHSAPQWEDGIPIAYQCQVLHQLAVTGHAWADVAVLIGGQDFRIYRIERDDDKIADLITREARFWRQIEQDIQPGPDGSDDAGSALQWLFPQDSGSCIDLSESSDGTALFDTLLALKLRREEIDSQESQAKQQLQNLMGTASTAVFAGGKVSWKKTRDRSIADLERLGAEQPELLKQYSKTVAGSRRFLLQTERSTA
ncbi:YqaJ viral recombinase family protein [Ralstonia pseudosolanacearum]|uniref:YqaJ viral recombinase family nuclease n=1 Tax=Ralstonia pseudosolanacearum TaxID=1310165 RepID=UPI00048DB1F0|nr:YqaJ viral recombinase family protein [Ralstonia pseudosolanacearum]MDO3558657.1 YqaJ viral recombinase family protein [Ralstonia pseudosolanacearum]MDO3575111.1 YqaJ viral recombinase family protein [Ralstonia pseudosolanacearum]MDO3584995.1 YqaJ viral recombinase family protein [Ralstonia pseudosolanacearum]